MYLGTPVAQTFTEADMPHYVAIHNTNRKSGDNQVDLVEVTWVKQLSTVDIASESDLRRLKSGEFYYKLRVEPGVDIPKRLNHVVRVEMVRKKQDTVHIEQALSGFSSKEDMIAEYVDKLDFKKKKSLFNTALEIVRGS
jgi:hypothetical protein